MLQQGTIAKSILPRNLPAYRLTCMEPKALSPALGVTTGSNAPPQAGSPQFLLIAPYSLGLSPLSLIMYVMAAATGHMFVPVYFYIPLFFLSPGA